MNRERLPDTRSAITHKFKIRAKEGEVKGYITAGCYDDGRLGEIFVKMDQQGSQVSGFVDAWSIAVSMLLQGGMTPEEIVRKFRGTRFEPSGYTDNPNIRMTTSPIDYIVRWIEGKYVDPELFAEDDEEQEDEDQNTCEKCDSTDSVRLSRGKFLCRNCCSGKVAP